MARGIVSPLPEPDRGGFLSTLRGAADSLWSGIKRTFTTPFGQKTVSPLAEEEPGHVRVMFDRTPSAAPARRATPAPSVRPTPTSSPSMAPQGQPVGAGQLARNPAISRFNPQESVVAAITQAARQYGIPPQLLFDIALQESGFNPGSLNQTPEGIAAGNPKGLFQFIDNSWSQVMRELGLPETTPQTDPRANALAAAYSISKGRLNWWDASKNIWGPFYSEEELAPYYAQTLGRR